MYNISLTLQKWKSVCLEQASDLLEPPASWWLGRIWTGQAPLSQHPGPPVPRPLVRVQAVRLVRTLKEVNGRWQVPACTPFIGVLSSSASRRSWEKKDRGQPVCTWPKGGTQQKKLSGRGGQQGRAKFRLVCCFCFPSQKVTFLQKILLVSYNGEEDGKTIEKDCFQRGRHTNERKSRGTSLAVHWLRLCLPVQGLQVWSLVGELRSHMSWGQKTKQKPEAILKQIQ